MRCEADRSVSLPQLTVPAPNQLEVSLNGNFDPSFNEFLTPLSYSDSFWPLTFDPGTSGPSYCACWTRRLSDPPRRAHSRDQPHARNICSAGPIVALGSIREVSCHSPKGRMGVGGRILTCHLRAWTAPPEPLSLAQRTRHLAHALGTCVPDPIVVLSSIREVVSHSSNEKIMMRERIFTRDHERWPLGD